MARKPKTHNFRFQYIGDGPVSSGWETVSGKKEAVLHPNDEIVVSDVDTADYLRVLSDWREVSSPTTDKPTHRKSAPKKSAPAKPKGK